MNWSKFVGGASTFLADRFPAKKLNAASMLTEKEVPLHRMSWAYYLGGLALFFFVVQVVTGLLLLFYYEPTVSDAHASVEYISEHVAGGALIRNMHAWSSSALILAVMIHLLTTFAMKAFAKPRELTWITGVGLFVVAFGFGFTGYLLPWNQIAVNATKVGLQSIEAIGEYLPGAMSTWPAMIKETIQGEASVGQATLSRFYALHVIILPLIMFGLLGVHLLSVQIHGMSRGAAPDDCRQEKFFPFFIIKDLSVWGVAFLGLFVLALCLPFDAFFAFPLAEPFDPLGSTPDGIKPEWYFFFLYYPLEILPFWLVMLLTNILGVVLLLAPWIFRRTTHKTLRALAIAGGAYLFVMTVFGQQIYEMIKGGHG